MVSLHLTLWALVLSGEIGASSHPNLCYCQRRRHANTQGLWKVLEEERDVNSDLLNAWDCWYYLIRDPLLNLYKMLWAQGSIWKLDLGSVTCVRLNSCFIINNFWTSVDRGGEAQGKPSLKVWGFFTFSMWEAKDSGCHDIILSGNQGKTEKKCSPQFCFQRNLFQLGLSLRYRM